MARYSDFQTDSPSPSRLEILNPEDPRDLFLHGIMTGEMPRVPSVHQEGELERQRSGISDIDRELADIASGNAPAFATEQEPEKSNFWSTLAELGGIQGHVDLRHSGPLGALIALGATFANLKAHKAAKERETAHERNIQRVESNRRLNTMSEMSDRAYRLERMRQLGIARRAAMGGARTGSTIYVPGAGDVPIGSSLGQRYLTQQAESAGTPLAPRWEPQAEPRPAPGISSLEEQDAEATYKKVLNDYRANYWWQRSHGSPENYATWAGAPLPADEQQKAENTPEARNAFIAWRGAMVLRVARNARTQEDLDDLEAALERAPAEVRSDPRVLRAVQDATRRIH